MKKSNVVVVTGLSGAGKSTALHALEDLGYFCIDNLPPSLIPQTIEVCEAGGIDQVGLGLDMRVGSFLEGAALAIAQIKEGQRDILVLFLDASDIALLRRFNETRRPHPLRASFGANGAETESFAVLDGIHFERERLAPLRADASIVLDTTMLSVHELRRQVIEHVGRGGVAPPRMMTRVVSFGYKYGVPVDADLMFDVRFLDNPFFVPELRNLTGLDVEVKNYVLNNGETTEYLQRVEDLLTYTMPRYEREGRSYLNIGVGCTGGRHRSVVIASVLGETLRKQGRSAVFISHRDASRLDSLGDSALHSPKYNVNAERPNPGEIGE